ncbi:MAG: hypothetical protein ACKVRP_08045 [Bacteroidota bacterium]
MIEVLLSFFIFLLAYSNGANDIPKGIAALVGSGATNIRIAKLLAFLLKGTNDGF